MQLETELLDDAAASSSKTEILAERIARELEDDIIFGRVKPGQRLPEEELSERFSASRHHVREALAQLSRIGIVSKERNRSVMVRSFTVTEVNEIYEIRELLQRQAALKIPLPISRSKLTELEEIHARYELAIGESDLRRINQWNDRFHMELFRLCGNDFLTELIKRYMDFSYLIRANAFNPEHLVVGRSEHRVMLDLLSTQDSWALSQICIDHIQYSKKQYLLLLTLQNATPSTNDRSR
jgi:DNA-binding GntR family transcriptional regulator